MNEKGQQTLAVKESSQKKSPSRDDGTARRCISFNPIFGFCHDFPGIEMKPPCEGVLLGICDKYALVAKRLVARQGPLGDRTNREVPASRGVWRRVHGWWLTRDDMSGFVYSMFTLERCYKRGGSCWWITCVELRAGRSVEHDYER
ncbi:hypothetical protein DEO72_LG5g981 [Vigna unguiculata]|uniref:Uncharacterized protein n=1 Tax=Vigna unguiculata TaxID=3917 RepID=A0A4D6LVF4_VIGUN|nr:hypothetical protein DEO72_LG5g981 [Vigna unguiculata]